MCCYYCIFTLYLLINFYSGFFLSGPSHVRNYLHDGVRHHTTIVCPSQLTQSVQYVISIRSHLINSHKSMKASFHSAFSAHGLVQSWHTKHLVPPLYYITTTSTCNVYLAQYTYWPGERSSLVYSLCTLSETTSTTSTTFVIVIIQDTQWRSCYWLRMRATYYRY